MRIGLIGCGNIGKFLLQAINQEGLLPGGKIVSIFSRRKEVATQVAQTYETKAYDHINSFINSGIDIVIEAATIEAAAQYTLPVLKNGANLILSSIGVLANEQLTKKIRTVCSKEGANVLIPSGAIGGLDLILSAKAVNGLDTVLITTRKPPSALPKAQPLTGEVVIFKGSAAEAIKKFPRNINVAIALSLAGLGPDQTDVKIIADPHVTKNNHTIEASGSFGKFKLQVENNPMPNNPKTSFLAAMSILAVLQNKESTIKVGSC